MAAVSILGPGGYPRAPHGSFTGKPASGKTQPLCSVLGPGGYPRPPYASFAGKPLSGRKVSVLGPGGYPRPPYGSFAGRISGGGKTQPLCSVLGAGGYPRPPYGSFAGKVPSAGGSFLPHAKPFLAHPALLMTITGDQTTPTPPPSSSFLVETAGYVPGTLNMLPWTAAATFTDFTGAQWAAVRASVSTGVASPDGGASAQHLAEDSSNGTHHIGAAGAGIIQTPNVLYLIPIRVAVIAKAGERSRIVVQWVPDEDSTNGSVSVGFDLIGGNVGYDEVVGSNQTLLAADMVSLGNGWWLCTFDAQYTHFANQTTYVWEPQIFIDASSGMSSRNISYSGNGTSGVNLWWFNIMPLQAWAMTQQVFFDDFTSLSTIDVNDTKDPGFNWYVHNMFPNSSMPTFGWQTNPPSSPTLASYLNISSPSVLEIYNPNHNQNGYTSQIWSVVTNDGHQYVGQAFRAPLMFDGYFSFDNTVADNNPQWLGHPSFWGVSVEALTNNGLNPSFHFLEWDTFESNSPPIALTVHDWNDPSSPADTRVASGGGTISFKPPAFHRMSSIWINAAANNGWGSFWSFIDGQLGEDSVGLYNASIEAQPQINDTTPGVGSNFDGHHMTVFLNTGEDGAVTTGGWPFYIDWVKVYGYPIPPAVYAFWNYFDQPLTGSNPKIGALVTANNGLQITKTSADSAWDTIRAHIGKGAGKWYWELTITGTVASSTSLMLGVVNQVASVASGAYPGSSSSGAGARHGSNWNALANGVTTPFSGTVAFAANDVFGFAFDADNGWVFIHRNGTWINGAPSGGSGNAVWTGLTTASPGINAAGWYPAAAMHDTTCTVTANFGASALIYAVPPGYNAGLF